jgi:hypothetical protein
VESAITAVAGRPVPYVPDSQSEGRRIPCPQGQLGDREGAIAPLLEVPSVPWVYEAEEPIQSIDEHVSPVSAGIQGVWGGRLVYVRLRAYR